VRGTIEAVERELVEGGFVLRYRTADTGDVDGLTGQEGAFLACSFWLADCLSLLGRDHDARQLLDRLLGLRNDLGLLSEEYDPVAGRLVGNFPQAFSHVSLVNSASKIGGDEKPSSSHVMAGLARRALTQTKTSPGNRHMGSFNARSMLSKLVESADTDVAGRAAHVVKEAIGSPSGPAVDRGRPTTKPTAKKAAKVTAKKATKAAKAKKAAKATKAPAKKRTPAPKTAAKKTTNSTPVKKVATKRAPVKKAPAKGVATRRKAVRSVAKAPGRNQRPASAERS
jgi:hypothetical protein